MPDPVKVYWRERCQTDYANQILQIKMLANEHDRNTCSSVGCLLLFSFPFIPLRWERLLKQA